MNKLKGYCLEPFNFEMYGRLRRQSPDSKP